MKRERMDELDRLLAKGHMSRPEKERLFEDVLARATPRPRSAWDRLLASRLRFALPAVALLLLAPLLLLRRSSDEFHEKGAAAAAPIIELGCADGCRAGAVLLFRTARVTTPSRLSAFAEDGAGQRIWYFPTETGEQPTVDAHEAPAALARGVRLGPEHHPGSYRVTVLLTPASEPVPSRDQLLARRSKPGVLVQPLEIVP
jgi:hypothetical protein